MPVTAKLSKAFYDKLGEGVANELVEWFNSVDATYRSDLRELNELNFARFDAKLEQRLAGLRADIEGRFAVSDVKLERLRADFDTRFAVSEVKLERLVSGLRAEVESRFAASDAKLERLISGLRAELIKWAFVFFATAALAVIGLR